MFDPYTGDYGPNFFGHAMNTGTFLTQDDALGWICFGGNVAERDGSVHATILDSSRDRVFIAPLGLWINLDAGHLVALDFNPTRRTVQLHLAPATNYVQNARLRLKQTTTGPRAHEWRTVTKTSTEAGADVVPLGRGETLVTLQEVKM